MRANMVLRSVAEEASYEKLWFRRPNRWEREPLIHPLEICSYFHGGSITRACGLTALDLSFDQIGPNFGRTVSCCVAFRLRLLSCIGIIVPISFSPAGARSCRAWNGSLLWAVLCVITTTCEQAVALHPHAGNSSSCIMTICTCYLSLTVHQCCRLQVLCDRSNRANQQRSAVNKHPKARLTR